MMERLASTNICERHFSSHLSDTLINRRFRAMFGVSSRTAHLLWVTLDIDTLGPRGGKRIHLLWMLMFLKEYCTQDSLSGICGVTRKTRKFYMISCRCVPIPLFCANSAFCANSGFCADSAFCPNFAFCPNSTFHC